MSHRRILEIKKDGVISFSFFLQFEAGCWVKPDLYHHVQHSSLDVLLVEVLV